MIPTLRLSGRPGRAGIAVPWWLVLGAPFAVLALAMASSDVDHRLPGSYASTSTAAHALLVAAGAALLAAAAVGWLVRPHELAGRVAIGLGVAWLAQELVGWAAGPTWVSTVAMMVAPWSLPLLVHLAFAFPDTRVRRRVARPLVVGTYVATAVVSVAALATYDPFFDVDCWRACTEAPFVISNRPELWDAVRAGWLSVVVVGTSVATVHAAGGVERRPRWPPPLTLVVLVPLAVASLLEAVLAASLLTTREDPAQPWFALLFAARAVAMTALGVGTAVWFARLAVQRRRLARLAGELVEAAPGRLEPLLARSLGDDSVEVAYWSSTLGRYVDGEGRPVTPQADPARADVAVERGGQHLGVVTQDRALVRPDVVEQIGAAARLAFDNERLRAVQLAQIAELRRARSHIVRTADETRRRIERDLHDGAQQRLLALSFELRLAAASAAERGESEAHRALELAARDARAGIDELRELAHGIFPSVLTTAGLCAALDALRDDAELPIRLDVTAAPLEPAAEMAAYVAVVESVDAAAAADVESVCVQGCRRGEWYHLAVQWSGGRQPPDVVTHVADRVGAVGGELRAAGSSMEVVLPCVPS